MGIVAVSGDLTTTTSVALASGWAESHDVILVEADPSGGDLAAWFDMPVVPSLSTVVTRVLDGEWSDIERHTRLAENGLRVIPAPVRSVEAAQAVGESARSLVPTLASRRIPITIADTGRFPVSPASHPFVGAAAVHVLVHRQATQSARAAAVRLQRLAEHLDALVPSPAPVVAAIVGTAPFGIDEISEFVASSVGRVPVVSFPDDVLAAGVFAGRTGVSARRLARLPLVRAARELVTIVEATLASTTGDPRRVVT